MSSGALLHNWLVTYDLDRASHRRRDKTWLEERLHAPTSVILPVWRLQNLFAALSPAPRLARLSPSALEAVFGTPNRTQSVETFVFLGRSGNDCAYFSVVLAPDDSTLAERFGRWGEFRELRTLTPLMEPWEAALAAYARAMAYWHHHHRFCGVCGHPTLSTEGGFIRLCCSPECGEQHFPRTDPAVIVRVTSGEHILLARQAHWMPYMYSVLAGYVEPGESLETAVAREVWEETGIHLAEVRYHSSQPWPFPSSLMLGFTALAADTRICRCDGELEDARWFSRSDIQRGLQNGTLRLPIRSAIAFRLIQEWFDAGDLGTLEQMLAST